MSAQHGIIARISATNGIPSYRGYDLRLKNPNKTNNKLFIVDDFELIFQGFSCERFEKLDSEKVLTNIDKTIFRVYDQLIETTKEISKSEQPDTEQHSISLNGIVIKEIIKKDGKYQAVLQSEDMDEASRIVSSMFNCWVNAKAKKMEKEFEITNKMRSGTLDIEINKETKNESLVLRNDSEVTKVGNTVDTQRVKETLFFITELYKATEKFNNQVNCSHEEDGFKCEFNKNKMSISKVSGNFTELELSIAKDLLKLKG